MANPLTKDETEFVRAIEDFKKEKGKLFLSWTEVLGIVKDLGYVQNAQKKKSPSAKAKASKKKAMKKAAPKVTPQS